MKKRDLLMALPVAAVVGLTAHIGPVELCQGFLPENNMKIPVGDVNALGIQEDEFNAVLDRIEEIYTPLVAAKGGNLVVKRLWENDTVNASAQQWGSSWIINMYGGLARHQAITADGFALVACHEIGHHLAGTPKSWGWASNEGQSDYFATLKCLRRFYGNGAAAKDTVSDSCQDSFGDEDSQRICGRNAQSGLSVATLFKDLRNLPEAPKFDTPDQSQVDRTNNRHPAPQCRLDTYFQGSLCTAPLDQDVSNRDPNAGTCTEANGYSTGLRPRCWYAPPASAAGMASAKEPVRERMPTMGGLSEKIGAIKAALSAS